MAASHGVVTSTDARPCERSEAQSPRGVRAGIAAGLAKSCDAGAASGGSGSLRDGAGFISTEVAWALAVDAAAGERLRASADSSAIRSKSGRFGRPAGMKKSIGSGRSGMSPSPTIQARNPLLRWHFGGSVERVPARAWPCSVPGLQDVPQ